MMDFNVDEHALFGRAGRDGGKSSQLQSALHENDIDLSMEMPNEDSGDDLSLEGDLATVVPDHLEGLALVDAPDEAPHVEVKEEVVEESMESA